MSVLLLPDYCPPDPEEVTQAYVMDNLPIADVAAFEEHLLVCAGCRAAVEHADKYVKAMRQATRRLRVEQGARRTKP